MKIPQAHTLLEIIRIRYGEYAIPRQNLEANGDDAMYRHNGSFCVDVLMSRQQLVCRCQHVARSFRCHNCTVRHIFYFLNKQFVVD
jgi:hypothetical protein